MAALFITGASSAIGRGLLDRWRGEREVLALTRRHDPPPWCTSVPGDLTRPGLGLSRSNKKKRNLVMTTLLNLIYREYCLARLAEMRQPALLLLPAATHSDRAIQR